MQLGDWIVQRPTAGDHRCGVKRGRVVYIHPEGRFYTLEFTFERFGSRMSFRESYLTGRPIDDDEVPEDTAPRGAVAQQARPRQGTYLQTDRRNKSK